MSIRLLRLDAADSLCRRPATAPESLVIPGGYEPFHHARRLRRTDLDGAAEDLLSWRLHDRSGLSVQASDIPLRRGTVVLQRVGGRIIGIDAPCRVIEVFQEQDRRGFADVTLRGHPESGVECFEVLRGEDGALTVQIRGYSRPGSWSAKLAPRVASAFQRRYSRRYLEALDRG